MQAAWVGWYVGLCMAFALEEFVLIKPVSTVELSDPLSRRVELLAIWVPALGIALCGAFAGAFGGQRFGGVLNAVGVGFCIAGLALRYWARRVLGRFFTIGVVRQEGHRVVREGPYRWARHPGYLGFMLFYLGLPLVVGSFFGLLVLTLPAVAIFVILVRIEDERMEEELGEPYSIYRRETDRLIPGLW